MRRMMSCLSFTSMPSGFALLLKFYTRAGRFPRGRAELDDDAVAFVARQVGVPASDLGFYASPWRSTPASPSPTPSSATTTSSATSPSDSTITLVCP